MRTHVSSLSPDSEAWCAEFHSNERGTVAVERNEDVLRMVEQKLKEREDISTDELYQKAREIDADIGDLSARQFNARYPLQIKRKMSQEQKANGDSKPSGEAPEAQTQNADGADEESREQVFAMIEEALRNDPDVSNSVLQQRAAEIDPSIAELSARSFNARFPLQVKRHLAAEAEEEEEAKEEKQTAASAPREELRTAVREALISFARKVTGAEHRGEVIDVVLKIEDYVDGVMEKA